MLPKFISVSFIINFADIFIGSFAIFHGIGIAKTGQFPMVAAIIDIKHNGEREAIGTGILIGPHYVLGSIRYKFSAKIHIVAGAVQWENRSIPTYQESIVTHIFRRHQTQIGGAQVPLELYRVDKPFVRNKGTQYALLKYVLPHIGWKVTSAGFGHAFQEDYRSSKVLVTAGFEIVNHSECVPHEVMNWDMFCVANRTETRMKFLGVDFGAPVLYKKHVIGIATSISYKYDFTTVLSPRRYKEWIALHSAWDGKTPNPNAIPLKKLRRRIRGCARKLLPSIYAIFILSMSNNQYKPEKTFLGRLI